MFLWRLAMSEHISDSYADIRDRWTLPECVDAHLLLDFLESRREPPREW